MYLTDLFIQNSGPITKLRLQPQFTQDGLPKPIVLVGMNGSGKTGLLSVVADTLVEIAAQKYQNVTPQRATGRAFFRILGGRSQQLGSSFEIAAARFAIGQSEFVYRAKSGKIMPADLSTELSSFGNLGYWTDANTTGKDVAGPTEQVVDTFDSGVYAFFPSTRFEIPYWANSEILDREPEGDFDVVFNGQLAKPIVVQSALRSLPPWIMNLMLDCIINSNDVLSAPDLGTLRAKAKSNHTYINTYQTLNRIVQFILKRDDITVGWLGRRLGNRRVSLISAGQELAIPSLDCLSAGQSTLLSVFGTILRYGDFKRIATSAENMEGVVIVDEFDAHLHADLQFSSLPSLIKLFPRIQFIMTSHSPLFPLGMRKTFGEEGFTLVDLPSGLTIDAERYSEFESSFAFFRETQKFEEAVVALANQARQPLILCEGETDPKYLRTAAELLGFMRLLQETSFEYVGRRTARGVEGSGQDNLEQAFRFFKNNPNLVGQEMIFLFDCDVRRKAEDAGRLHVRILPRNPANDVRTDGIENLLPPEILEPRFFHERDFMAGSDRAKRWELQKTSLCTYLCDEKRAASDFEGFRASLTEMADLLLSDTNTKPE